MHKNKQIYLRKGRMTIMKQELLREQLAVLEVLAKVNQSGHKCNTEIKELVEAVKATLKDVEDELAIFHDEDPEEDEEEDGDEV